MKSIVVLLFLLLAPLYAEAAPELQTVEDGWLIIDSQPAAGGTEQTVEDAWLIVDSSDGIATTQTVEDAWLVCDYSAPEIQVKVRQN